MGWSDSYCTICSGPYFVTHERGVKNKWLSHIVGINFTDDHVILKGNNYSYGGINYGVNQEFKVYWFDGEYSANGVVCHQACIRLLQTKLNYTFKLKHILWFLPEINSTTQALLTLGDYGAISQYCEQTFDFDRLYNDKADYLLKNPNINKRNQKRIIHMWKTVVDKIKVMTDIVGRGSF
jgi:hypothetical protein